MERSFATRADDAEFARFCCCPPNAPPWEVEVENYVRASVLGHADYTLALRDENEELIAVSAFDRRPIDLIPLTQPSEQPGWHLQVVAVRLDAQQLGRAEEVFAHTFEAMREVDGQRNLISAAVHRDHGPSLKACERVGLEPLIPTEDGEYWILLGSIRSPR